MVPILLLAGCAHHVVAIGLDTPIPLLHDTAAMALPDVTLVDARGRPAAGEVEWEVVDPTVARLEGGRLGGVQNGDTELVARVAKVEARWPLRVRMPTDVEIRLPTLHVGETGWGTAVALAGDEPQPEVPVTWASRTPEVAVVDGEGRIRVIAEGVATLEARTGTVLGTAQLVVGPTPPVAPIATVAVSRPSPTADAPRPAPSLPPKRPVAYSGGWDDGHGSMAGFGEILAPGQTEPPRRTRPQVAVWLDAVEPYTAYADVWAVITKQLPTLADCYWGRLYTEPTLRAAFEFEYRFDPTGGSPYHHVLRQTLLHDPLATCVRNAMGDVPIVGDVPAATGRVTVRFDPAP